MRLKIAESNVMQLAPTAVGTPKISDPLFAGNLQKSTLIHSLLLEITINASAGTITEASLGWITLKNNIDGDLPKLPVRFLAKALPYLGYPCRESGTATAKLFYVVIPFALIQGIRPKDTYIKSNAQTIWTFEYFGVAEAGVTYTAYNILPIIVGEASSGIDIPAKGLLKYSSEAIPAGVHYTLKSEVYGATSLVLAKSDYAAFVADKFRLYVDNDLKINCNDIRRLDRIALMIASAQSGLPTVDTTPDTLIFVPVSLDSKMAKISRGSRYIMAMDVATTYTIQLLWQQLEGKSEAESLAEAQRQAPNLVITEDMLPLPVDINGTPNALIKPISRKLKRVSGNTVTKIMAD